jgi:putative ABC transport system permease protein
MFWLMVAASLVVLMALALWRLGPKGRSSIHMAARNLLLQKLRSFLSVLGIIIGTTSVMVLMAIGEGSMQDALEDIKRQGASNLFLVSVKPPEGDAVNQRTTTITRYGLTHEDHHRFAETLWPTVDSSLSLRTFNAEIRPITDSRVFQGRVVATQPRYADVFKLHRRMAMGRFLSEQDERQVANVVVLGAGVANELFVGTDPLGKKIKIKDRAFEVVGVLQERASNSGGREAELFDGDVYIPLQAWRERIGQLVVTSITAESFIAEDVQLSQIILTVRDIDQVRFAAELVRAQLRKFHDKGDVELRVPLDRLEEAERTRDRYRMLLFFIAGISLVVGGIGIMNIMLATVTERTREIGIRRALGATQGDIALQFLVEAVVQTSLGGLAGVALGFALIFAIPHGYLFWQEHVQQLASSQLTKLPVQVHMPSVLLAFSVALAVGVLFGWYPARRAALLDPIEALRHE